MAAHPIQMHCQNCSELALPQTRNSNHSANQVQSISQACLWQTEELLPCHLFPVLLLSLPSAEQTALLQIDQGSVTGFFVPPIPSNPVCLIWQASLGLFLQRLVICIGEDWVDLFKDTFEQRGFCCSEKAIRAIIRWYQRSAQAGLIWDCKEQRWVLFVVRPRVTQFGLASIADASWLDSTTKQTNKHYKQTRLLVRGSRNSDRLE